MVILDMPMPKNCWDCPLCYDYQNCGVTGTQIKYENMEEKRLNDCPIKGLYDPKRPLEDVLSELRAIDTTTDERNFACYCDGLDDAKEVVEKKIKEYM